jgi:hypothetical protein
MKQLINVRMTRKAHLHNSRAYILISYNGFVVNSKLVLLKRILYKLEILNPFLKWYQIKHLLQTLQIRISLKTTE